MENKNLCSCILTFNEADNYGAMCQAYALSAFINANLCHCVILNYHNDCIWSQFHFVPKFKHFLNIKRNIELLSQSKRRKKFNTFRKSLPLSEKCDRKSVANISKKFDKIIVGSDQVWNPKNTDADSTFLLDFCESRKKIAYAASFGNTDFFYAFGEQKENLLKDFSWISVRENDGKDFLTNRYGLLSKLVLDPTLLIKRDEWKKVAQFKYSQKYIFVYQLKPDLDFVKSVQSFASKKGLSVISVPYLLRCYVQNKFKKGIKTKYNVGPAEFLGLILNAEYVLTDSFHGVALSIAMQKQFYVKLNPNKTNTNGRITSLLNLLNIEKRTFEHLFELDNISYDAVNNILLNEIEHSRLFLASAIFEDGVTK